ncbi:MAG: glycosyltransferase family 2 protein [Microbacteriaceae bacterium]
MTTEAGTPLGVSYVMPVLNEAAYIESSVITVLAQDYPGEKELIVVLGPSVDGTDAIIERLAAADPRIRLVDNPEMDIPVGLNRAIRASRHPIIVRVDAHSELGPDYTSRAVGALRRTGAANVGGVMKASGKTPFQSAVAWAYNSPFGLGGATYHSGHEEGPAESAYLGVFRREVLDEVDLFDESLRRGEDWELNLRIRAAGHLVWFDPALQVTYWPRESWTKLVRQFCATGIWRGELVRRYRGRNPWRFFAPPLLVVGVLLAAAAAAVQAGGLIGGWGSAIAGLAYLPLLAYLLLLIWAALLHGPRPRWRDRWLAFLVLPTMHLSWGSGFIVGLLRGARDTVDTSRTAA